MKKLFIICMLFTNICDAQSVYIEIDHWQKTQTKEFSTYQFVDASYSYSRATLPIVASKSVYAELLELFPNLRGVKKEYTDYWVLGIDDLKKGTASEFENKILNEFYLKILKYRADNNLVLLPEDQLKSLTIFISDKSEICKYLPCGKLKR